VVPYLYENVSAYGQNPAGAGLNQIRNCSVYSPSEVGTSIMPNNIFLFFSFFGLPSSFTYNDMIITLANTNACGVGTNPILHYIDLWLPANRTLTSTIEIFEGSNLVPSATYRRDNITTGGATITVAGQPMLPFRIYASDIVSAQGVSQNYIRPFNNGATQFRIRVRIDAIFLGVPNNTLFPNMPIMTVNMSSTYNIISNNSGITNQITTSFADTTITNNTSYRFGFLPLGITNPNQVWIQIGSFSPFAGFTISRYTCSLENIASSVTINNIGRFRIRATTRLSDRYESVFIDSQEYAVTSPQTVTFTGTVNFETIYVNSLNQVVSNPILGGFTIYRVTSTSAGASYVINSNSASTPISFLIVGGGGTGAGSGSGGLDLPITPGAGGAGGLIDSSGTTNSNTPYSIYVGRGGVASNNTANGEDSLLQLNSGTLTAIGGGGGGNPSTNLNGLNGGSGGSGASNVLINGTGGSGTPGQGFSGTRGNNRLGGAGGAGGNGSFNGGGPGLPSNITGQSIFYAGGGGSGFSIFGVGAGTGGIGGGGNIGTRGTDGLGGGGGGGVSQMGTSGGSGVVILRIPSFI
jgi:hypothetical protein